MKKFYVSMIAAAALLTACEKNDVLVDQEEFVAEKAISFDTFASTATRNADNSSSAQAYALEAHHTHFEVWGYKNVAGSDVKVFDEVDVQHNGTVWTYSPVRYWDKSAAHYKFYAVAPYAAGWDWDDTNRKASYANFSLTGATLAPSATVDANAVFSATGDVDLMLAHDITNHTTYTTAAVNLQFDHILSRLNIGVKKDASVTDVVTLNAVKVYNMKSNGSFDENEASAVNTGSIARWKAADTPTTFTAGVGYATDTEVTTTLNYVYQGLCIPQEVAYAASFKLDGTDKSATCAPYLYIKYTINNESFEYYYNLADIFNGATSTDNISFFEGWQNTLKITINPIAIKFDAEVYEWATKNEVDVNVPNE